MKSLQGRNIRWGIIGLGNIAHKFAEDLLTVDGAELYAVASRTQPKADTFAQQYQATQAYCSYEALVNDPKVDAVYIATPHVLHKENTLLCLQKGIAVLCEKPFAMNANEVNTMISVAQQNKTLLMEAMWTYFLPHYQFVLNELARKTYGPLFKVEADFGFSCEYDEASRLFRKSLGGGSLLDIGIYPIFVALSTLGVPDNKIAYATFFDNGADSACSVLFNYKNGSSAILKSTLLQSTPCEAVFHCEQGTIKINREFHCPSSVTLINRDGQKTINFECESNGYSYEIIHFNKLLRQGKTESDIMSFDFSRNLINTLDNVREVIGLQY
jgi:predicted dehydrogenase